MLEAEIRGHICTQACLTPTLGLRPAWRDARPPAGLGLPPHLSASLRGGLGLRRSWFLQEVFGVVLTVANVTSASAGYYERDVEQDDAKRLDASDYYSEHGDAPPVVKQYGDRVVSEAAFGVRHGARLSAEQARNWIAEGKTPQGKSVGNAVKNTAYDATFCAPKGLSLIYALGSPEQRAAALDVHHGAVDDAMAFFQTYAGFTRRHNNETGQKDLVPLVTLDAAEYLHTSSRDLDPHLHSHMTVSNRQVREDGKFAAIDGRLIYDSARAIGEVYQASERCRAYREERLRLTHTVDVRTGQADPDGFKRSDIKAFSKRSSALDDWATDRDMEAVTAAQRAVAQKDTRASKFHSGKTREEVIQGWQQDPRAAGIDLTPGAGIIGRAKGLEVEEPLAFPTPEQVKLHLALTKSAYSRLDVIESVATLWPQNADPAQIVEQIESTVDAVLGQSLQITHGHERPAHKPLYTVKYTSEEVIREEAAMIVAAMDRDPDLGITVDELTAMATAGLSADQRAAVEGIAVSDQRVTALVAPAGAGKTHSLSALKDVYGVNGRRLVGLAPSGPAADLLKTEGVADDAMTVALWRTLFEGGQNDWDANTVVVVDEAGMTSTPDLALLIDAASESGSKVVLVGDPYQLDAVNSRGGGLALLAAACDDSRELAEIWRQRDPGERTAGKALRDGSEPDIQAAAAFYDERGRIHAGAEVAMMHDAFEAWKADRSAGHDALFLASSWRYVDAANLAAQTDAGTLSEDSPRVALGRDQFAGVGDIILSRRGDYKLRSWQKDEQGNEFDSGPVRNGHRWRVEQILPDGSVRARRVYDEAVTTLPAAYLTEDAHLGYASTVHSAQGATADRVHSVLDSTSTQGSNLYVAITRGRDENHVYLAEPSPETSEREWTTPEERQAFEERQRLGNEERCALFVEVAQRGERSLSAHAEMGKARGEETARLLAQRDQERYRRESAPGDDERRSEPTEELSLEEAYRHQRAEQHRKQSEQAERSNRDESRSPHQSKKSDTVAEEHQSSERRQPQEREQAPQETRAEQVSKTAAEVKRDELLARKNKFQAKTEAAQAQRAQSQSQDSGQSL